MVGLWRGEGGWKRRVAGEVVPLLFGFVVASLAGPLLGLVGAVLVGLGAAALASGLLVRVRRHPRARRIYHVLLALHVLFWSWQGLRHSVPEPAPDLPPRVGAGSAWPGAGTFRAGVGEAFFVLPEETTLAGWGGPPRRRRWPAFAGLGQVGRLSLAVSGAPSEGVPPRAPLFVRPDGLGERLGARALVLLPDAPDAAAVAVVRLDLITLDPQLVPAVLGRVGELALTEDTLLLCATHTHTGPGGAMRAPAAVLAGTDHFDRRVFDAVADAAIAAIEAAVRTAVPARVAFFAARDRGADGAPILAENRATKDDRIDDRVLGMRVDARGDGRPIGVLLNYAVMPVLLRKQHRAFARDVPGAVEDALSALLPGAPLVLFVNGATGDVSPRRTFGKGVPGVLGVGRAFAEHVSDDVASAPAYDRLRVRATSAGWDAGSAYTFASVGPRTPFDERIVPAAFGRDLPSAVASLVVLPLNAVAWSVGLTEIRLGFTFDGAAGAVVNLEGRAGPRERRGGALLLEVGDESGVRTRACWLWQGGIPTQAVGKRWRQAVAARDLPTPFLFALTNDAVGYLTTPEEYDQPSYEARSSLFGRDAALRAEAALDAAVAALLAAGASGGAGSQGG